MYCHQCGKEIDDSVKYCPYCGSQQTHMDVHQEQMNQTTSQRHQDDESHIGWAILSFCIPIVGLVLYLVWKNEFPKKAKSCLKGFVTSIVLSVVMFCCVFASIGQIVDNDINDIYLEESIDFE